MFFSSVEATSAEGSPGRSRTGFPEENKTKQIKSRFPTLFVCVVLCSLFFPFRQCLCCCPQNTKPHHVPSASGLSSKGWFMATLHTHANNSPSASGLSSKGIFDGIEMYTHTRDVPSASGLSSKGLNLHVVRSCYIHPHANTCVLLQVVSPVRNILMV